MKFTIDIRWPSEPPDSHTKLPDYEPNGLAKRLAVSHKALKGDKTVAGLMAKVKELVPKLAPELLSAGLQLANLVDEDGAMTDPDDDPQSLFPDGADRGLFIYMTRWAERASKRRGDHDISEDASRKRRRGSGEEEEQRSMQKTPAVSTLIANTTGLSRMVESGAAHVQQSALNRRTSTPGDPFSANPAPTSAQRQRDFERQRWEASRSSSVHVPLSQSQSVVGSTQQLDDRILGLVGEPENEKTTGSPRDAQYNHGGTGFSISSHGRSGSLNTVVTPVQTVNGFLSAPGSSVGKPSSSKAENWNQEEDEVLLHHPTWSARRIVRELHNVRPSVQRTEASVRSRKRDLKMKKPKMFAKSSAAGRGDLRQSSLPSSSLPSTPFVGQTGNSVLSTNGRDQRDDEPIFISETRLDTTSDVVNPGAAPKLPLGRNGIKTPETTSNHKSALSAGRSGQLRRSPGADGQTRLNFMRDKGKGRAVDTPVPSRDKGKERAIDTPSIIAKSGESSYRNLSNKRHRTEASEPVSRSEDTSDPEQNGNRNSDAHQIRPFLRSTESGPQQPAQRGAPEAVHAPGLEPVRLIPVVSRSHPDAVVDLPGWIQDNTANVVVPEQSKSESLKGNVAAAGKLHSAKGKGILGIRRAGQKSPMARGYGKTPVRKIRRECYELSDEEENRAVNKPNSSNDQQPPIQQNFQEDEDEIADTDCAVAADHTMSETRPSKEDVKTQERPTRRKRWKFLVLSEPSMARWKEAKQQSRRTTETRSAWQIYLEDKWMDEMVQATTPSEKLRIKRWRKRLTRAIRDEQGIRQPTRHLRFPQYWPHLNVNDIARAAETESADEEIVKFDDDATTDESERDDLMHLDWSPGEPVPTFYRRVDPRDYDDELDDADAGHFDDCDLATMADNESAEDQRLAEISRRPMLVVSSQPEPNDCHPFLQRARAGEPLVGEDGQELELSADRTTSRLQLKALLRAREEARLNEWYIRLDESTDPRASNDGVYGVSDSAFPSRVQNPESSRSREKNAAVSSAVDSADDQGAQVSPTSAATEIAIPSFGINDRKGSLEDSPAEYRGNLQNANTRPATTNSKASATTHSGRSTDSLSDSEQDDSTDSTSESILDVDIGTHDHVMPKDAIDSSGPLEEIAAPVGMQDHKTAEDDGQEDLSQHAEHASASSSPIHIDSDVEDAEKASSESDRDTSRSNKEVVPGHDDVSSKHEPWNFDCKGSKKSKKDQPEMFSVALAEARPETGSQSSDSDPDEEREPVIKAISTPAKWTGRDDDLASETSPATMRGYELPNAQAHSARRPMFADGTRGIPTTLDNQEEKIRPKPTIFDNTAVKELPPLAAKSAPADRRNSLGNQGRRSMRRAQRRKQKRVSIAAESTHSGDHVKNGTVPESPAPGAVAESDHQPSSMAHTAERSHAESSTAAEPASSQAPLEGRGDKVSHPEIFDDALLKTPEQMSPQISSSVYSAKTPKSAQKDRGKKERGSSEKTPKGKQSGSKATVNGAHEQRAPQYSNRGGLVDEIRAFTARIPSPPPTRIRSPTPTLPRHFLHANDDDDDDSDSDDSD